MIVVHAGWTLFGLRLWGESSLFAMRPPRAGGRRKQPDVSTHPFAAAGLDLRDALVHLGVPPKGVDYFRHRILLPSWPGRPQPSPHLPAQPGDEGDATLRHWEVEAATLPYSPALDFLLALPDAPGDGAIVGDSLRAFAEMAKLALELAARGRVAPALAASRRSSVAAVWRAVLTDENDAARAALLRRALPEVCSAFADASPYADEGEDEVDVAGAALDALVDACVRGALALADHRLATGQGPAKRPGERWLRALGSTRGGNPGAFTMPTIEPLRDAVAAWRSPLDEPARGGLRTCFRLSAPDEQDTGGAGDPSSDAPWRLDFLLQAADDPSLLVPADQVWRARGPLKVLRRTLDQPQERLLGDLGRALRLFPPLEPALRGARPSSAALDAEGAYRFLREGAPLLAQAGFGVRVPAWWTRPSARLGLRLRAKAPSSPKSAAPGRLGLETLVEYDWRVSLGGESISAEEFRALAAHKVPLVRFRGEWVELKPGEMEAALRLFERGASGEMSAAELLRLAAAGDEGDGDIPVTKVEADGWLRDLLAAAGDVRAAPAEPPPGFHGELRPYQARGVGWLAFLDRLGLGACLADDMGLGKTVQLLALLLAEPVEEGKGKKKIRHSTLLVCPMSLVGNWQREAARFAPGLRVHVHHGGERLSGDALAEAVRGSDLVVTTYALAARDQAELGAVRWGRVVLDEAQNVKNAGARQSKAVRALQAPRRVALTGTPVENRLAELWSISEFLNPGLLGSAAEFRRRFATPIEKWRNADRAGELRRLTGPFILRRVKTDRSIIQDLPDKQEMKVFCNLTREQASLYQATVDEMMLRVETAEGIDRRGLVLSMLLRLKQVCDHPALLLGDGSPLPGRSGKLERLEEILEQVMETGERALVFTQYAEMGHLLRPRLMERLGREVDFLHGGTTKAARDAMVQRFQGDGGPPVLLLSLKAGGTGLTLTAANHVVHFDRWWNPAVEDQATDRAFRIGQTRNVQVRKLVCAGTLEERIDEMIEEKKALAASVLGTGEAWLTELSTAELRRVVALAPDAVAE